MNDELLKLLIGTVGGSSGGFVLISVLFLREWRNEKSDRQKLISVVEKNAVALTKLSSVIEEFNRVNGDNQKDCFQIRNGLREDIQNLSSIATKMSEGRHE